MIRWKKFILLIVMLAVVVTLSFPVTNYVKENANLGLDLAGGLYVLLQAEDPGEDRDKDEVVESALRILRGRVDELGVAEPVLQREGRDRIRVELAGGDLDREDAMEIIERTAQLKFFAPEIMDDPGFEYEALREVRDEESARISEDVIERHEPILSGDDLADASASYNPYGQPIVAVEFTSEGREKFAEATSKYVGRPIVMLLDNELISAPEISEPIMGGEASIENLESIEEARNIAVMLRSGALPVSLTELETSSVGPTLGAELLENSIMAGVIGLMLVLLFMIGFYRLPGLMSCFALALYLMILFLVLINIGATFTIPGIAGLILSVGMAVDANVIIFERIKEELRNKKTLRTSVDSGFKKALSTILDSNVTTLIGASILFYFGAGPIRGFAVTLSVGILASMFTAIVFSRLILKTLIQSRIIKSPRYFGIKGEV